MMIANRCAVLGVLCLFGFGAVLASGEGEKVKPFKHTASEEKIFELTNQERKKEEAPPLKLNPALSKIARAHSENMARQGKMAHDLDDKTPFNRLKEAGYFYSFAGENVGMGTENVSLPMLMKAWMDSKGHRENILKGEFTEIGVGVANDGKGTLYFTQVFAKPRKK